MENLKLLINTITKSHEIGIKELTFLFKIKDTVDDYVLVCLNDNSIEIKDSEKNITVDIDLQYPDFDSLTIDVLQNGKGRSLYDKLEESPHLNTPMPEFAQYLITSVAEGAYVPVLNAGIIYFIRSYTFRRGANIVIDTIYESLRLGLSLPKIDLFRACDENIIIKATRTLDIVHYKSVELEYTMGRDSIVTYIMESHHPIELLDIETSRAYLLEKIEAEISKWEFHIEDVSEERRNLEVKAYTFLKYYVKRYQ